jgi:peptidoglycan hydrolase-like protein with peptidoglycan-binding domain
MKRTISEELERIHTITYGKEVIEEQGLLDRILKGVGLKGDNKKVDDPKKADLVSDDVKVFFDTLQKAAADGGISQQERGSMNFQKEVESMQIGLVHLGYQLPKYGIDGLFGPETGAAVKKFKSDNSILNEDASELRSTLSSLGYSEKNGQLTSGGDITDDISSIVDKILKDFKAQKPDVKVVVTSGNDKFHKNVGYNSKHSEGNAVDLVLQPYNSDNATTFKNILNSYKSKNSKFNYIDEYTNPSSASTGGHFHLQYGGSVSSSVKGETATPEMLNKLIELLQQKGITSEDLKKYIDTVATGGGAQFTDLDLTTDEGKRMYAEICQKYISTKQSNLLNITGAMMASGAIKAFERHHKYVPPELALAQLTTEGGFSNDPNARPIKTKNPFNVGNTDSGANWNAGSVQDGIDRYYDLIAKDYLRGGKTAKDLVNNFVNKSGNRYASAGSYEQMLGKISGDVNKISQQVVSA